MKVKEVFEELIEQGYEPKYWFHEGFLLIDPDDIDPAEDFKIVNDLGLKALREGPFTEYDISETESNEIFEDIEEELKADGINPEAEVDGYFVYYDTEWKAWYPLILVRNWKLLEKTHDEPEKLRLLLSVDNKYIDSGILENAKIGSYYVTGPVNKRYIEIYFDWTLRGLAELYPDAVKEKDFYCYEIDLRKLRENFPNRF